MRFGEKTIFRTRSFGSVQLLTATQQRMQTFTILYCFTPNRRISSLVLNMLLTMKSTLHSVISIVTRTVGDIWMIILLPWAYGAEVMTTNGKVFEEYGAARLKRCKDTKRRTDSITPVMVWHG